jgi:hypothetical protein
MQFSVLFGDPESGTRSGSLLKDDHIPQTEYLPLEIKNESNCFYGAE